MAKSGTTKEKDIELQPDAWERFECAVKVVAKAPPQHRTKPAAKAKPRKKAKKAR